MTDLNIEVPTSLHRTVKVAAINAGKTLKEFVTEALAEKVGHRVESVPKPKAK